MTHFITYLGWTFLVLLTIIAIIALIGFIQTIKENRFNRKKKQLHDDIVHQLRSSSDWLDSPERVPFRDFLDYITKNIEKYDYVSSEKLREEVDRIVEKYYNQKDQDKPSF